MNVVNIERSRSGEADPSCSCRNRVGSILDGAVIAWFSCRTVEGLQEDHAVAALLVYATPLTRAYRTPPWWTPLVPWRDLDHLDTSIGQAALAAVLERITYVNEE